MRKYEDTYRHKGLRKQLLDQLRKKGITDERILEAMDRIPRHYFLDSAFEKVAYDDRAFPIAEGQTISQPYTVAYQTQLLEVKPHEKVLEIGTGSAYRLWCWRKWARRYLLLKGRRNYSMSTGILY